MSCNSINLWSFYCIWNYEF